MRLNGTGQGSSTSAGMEPLRQRLAGLSPPSGSDPDPRAGRDELREEARERLKAGHHGRRRPREMPGDAEARDRASKSWHLWVVFDILLLLLIVPIVVAVPPVLDCHKKQEDPGFFAGHSFEKCARDGISARWTVLDSRIKMIVRGSGQ